MRILPSLFITLTIGLLLCSCAGNEPEAKQPVPLPTPIEAPANTIAEQPTEPAAAAPNAEKKPAAIDSTVAKKTSITKKRPPAPKVGIIENRQFVSGYISRDKVVLQSKPEAAAPKTADFKRYDTVYIMETRMTDESGKAYDVPQWYKVQLTNKKEGWVVAKSVTMN